MSNESNSIETDLSICSSLEAISDLRAEWNGLHQKCSCRTIYNSFDFVYTSICHFNHPNDVLVFIVLREKTTGKMNAIFPFILSEYQWRMGKFRAILLAGREESDKAYPIIKSGQEKQVWPIVLEYLSSRKNDWSFIDLEEIREDAGAIKSFQTSFSKGYLKRFNKDSVSPIIDLSVSWEDFSSQHRKMRKRIRKLESTFADEFRFEVINDKEQVASCLKQYIELENRSWKLGAKVGIGKSTKTIEFYQNYFSLLANDNRVWFGFLYKGDVLVSAEIAYSMGKVVYFSHGCFDSSFRKLSPGMVSTSLFLEHFFQKDYLEGDFLGGFAKYIDPWASQLLPSKNIVVIKVTLKTVIFFILDKLRRLFYKPLKSRIKKGLISSNHKDEN